MKTVIALFAASLVTGCSSLPMQKAQADAAGSCDLAQMSRLERVAKQQRAELHWVNCPQLAKASVKA